MLPTPPLVAPPEDGGVLVHPRTGLAALAIANRRRLERLSLPVAGLAVGEVRGRIRRGLGLAPGSCVVVTGHQPELYHPGVWAKQVLCRDLASQVGGAALQVIVDHDKVKQRTLAVPLTDGDTVRLERLALPGFEGAEVHRRIAAWPASVVDHLAGRLRDLLGPGYGGAMLGRFLEGLKGAADSSGWVGQYTRALACVDAALDVDVPAVPASTLDFSSLFAAMIADADRFAACYNRALAAYRRAHGIRGARHPMPDLAVEPHRVELPLWALPPGGPRRRVHVGTSADRIVVWAGRVALLATRRGELLEDGGASLGAPLAGAVLQPRALTLTLFLRLCVADVFVHGIGGAAYDRITDQVIRDFFGVAAPPFAVATATLRLGAVRDRVDPGQRRRLAEMLRDVHFNPQRYVEDRPENSILLQRRVTLVDEAGRLRERARHDHAARRRNFLAIRAVNERLVHGCRERIEALARQLAALDRRLESERLGSSREYFYCLFSPERLEALASSMRTAARG